MPRRFPSSAARPNPPSISAAKPSASPPISKATSSAYVNGSAIQDGVIDVDIAVKITTPPGVRMPGFTGMAFRCPP